jgi:hypothetical protein
MTKGRDWTRIVVLLVAICPLAVDGQGTKPLGRGIQDVTDRIAQNKRQVGQLDNDVQGRVLQIGKIIYTAYGQTGDPGRVLLDLKETTEQVIQTIEAARTGRGNAAEVAQLILDDWSDLNRWVKAINVGQKVTIGELAPLVNTLMLRDQYQKEIATDTQILGNLQAESASLGARNTTPAPVQIQPQTRKFDFSALDDAVLLSRWLDMGNRAFSDPREEDAFYKRYPALERFRSVAETMSPRTDVERAGTIKQLPLDEAKKPLIPAAKEAAKPVAAPTARACVDSNVITSQLLQQQACISACIASYGIFASAAVINCYNSCDRLTPDVGKPRCP